MYLTIKVNTLFLGLFLLLNTNLSLDISKNDANIEMSSDYCEKGKVKQFGGLDCYISGPSHSETAIILITDVFGFAPSHSREIADKVAAAGYYTVLPDFFRGDPYQHGAPLTPWLKKHAPEEGIKDAIPIIEALKARGITKIGVAGFCWGGKVAADLSKYPYVEATVLLHPTYTTTEDIQGDKVPISILGGEKDTYCKPELVKEFENILKSKPEVDSFVKIVPGVDHGWTLRYNSSEFALKKAAESHNDMLDWFEMHLRY
ncbi:hypothetical protein ABFX02_14G013600 [Erythranthe guttata]